jgi:hypothetical protein
MSNAPATISWIQFIAGFGLGSIVAAIVGWFSAKAVVISNHRQAWINALRDDLVGFLKEVDVLHFRLQRMDQTGDIAELEKQQDARNAAMMAYRRVLMRLNTTEVLHVNLAKGLNDLMLIRSKTADVNKVDAVVNASREVLKYEWAVAKYGIFLPLMAPRQWRKKRRAVREASA